MRFNCDLDINYYIIYFLSLAANIKPFAVEMVHVFVNIRRRMITQ